VILTVALRGHADMSTGLARRFILQHFSALTTRDPSTSRGSFMSQALLPSQYAGG
jgi:hypothetical protein